MNEFKNFIIRYRGAIIGLIVAIIFLALKIYKLIIWLIVIAAGMFAGNYIQNNKEYVKSKVKNWIDRI